MHDALSAARNFPSARLLQRSSVRMQITTQEGSLTSSLLLSTRESPDNIIHLSLEAEERWEGGVIVVKRHVYVCESVCVWLSRNLQSELLSHHFSWVFYFTFTDKTGKTSQEKFSSSPPTLIQAHTHIHTHEHTNIHCRNA